MSQARMKKLLKLLGSKRPKGKLERLAITRQIDDLESGSRRGLAWDEDEARRAVDLFGLLRHWKGEWAGRPFELMEWQAECIVAPLFGWKLEDGSRRYRTAYIEIPRKNGKSTLAGGAAIKLAVADREPGAEVYAAATKKDQAKIVFNDAVNMIRRSKPLKSRVEVFKTSIVCPQLASTFKPLSKDFGSLDGLNTHGAVIDELHAHKSRELWDVITTSTGARRQPMVIAITTAGYNRLSVCWEQHEYGRKVLEGIVRDDSFFAFVAAADEGDDWQDPQTWWKANPNLGISLKLKYLQDEFKKAAESPAYQNTFRRNHLDQWTQQARRWMDLTKWDACGGMVEAGALRGRACFGGLDLATTTDIAAFVLVFPPEGDEAWAVLPTFFIPEDNILERVRRDKVPYDVWVRDGLIETTPGNVIDYRYILKRIGALSGDYRIQAVAFDRWGSQAIVNELAEIGVNPIQFGQGYASMGTPTKELLRLVLSGKLAHGGNPVLRWMADNIVIATDPAGLIKPDKARSTEKVDGIVALVMGLGVAQGAAGDKDKASIYEKRGPITFDLNWEG